MTPWRWYSRCKADRCTFGVSEPTRAAATAAIAARRAELGHRMCRVFKATQPALPIEAVS